MKRALVVCAVAMQLAWAATTAAQTDAAVHGRVVDPLGGSVGNAGVTLLSGGRRVSDTRTDQRGEFSFDAIAPSRYEVQVEKDGFAPYRTEPFFAGAGRTVVDVTLSIGPLRQAVVVTASATAVPLSQVGSQVTVLDAPMLRP